MSDQSFTILGKVTREPMRKLETFPTPANVEKVTLTSEEFTSLCPITGQPDFQTIEIEYTPKSLCLESKSLKLYLWSFREEGAFCEALASRIAHDINDVLKPYEIVVTITQKPRGGIAIKATSVIQP